MSESKDMDILLDIQKQLGTVGATVNELREDVKELKEKDLRQSDDLEKAYEKAKARQDSIRDDLQHQIDNNNQLISDIKASIDALSVTVTNVLEESKKNSEKLIKEYISKYDKEIETISTEIKNLKDEKKNKVFSWWEKIADKIFWIVVAIIFAAVFKYLNFTPPALPI